MPRNEDGEFELILGNRQLLSVFFIVVILLGVFFTMGWIVGRNSPANPVVEARQPDPKPIVVEPATRPTPSQPAATEPAPSPAPVAAPPPAAEKTKPEPPPQPAPAKPEPRRPAPSSPVPDEPPPGTYLQMTATGKPDAELYVDVLAKKGFHAIYTRIPEKPTMFRVLVGPLREASSVAQTRRDLEAAGLPGLKAIPRKF